jgi:DNA replication and repair protein RecF
VRLVRLAAEGFRNLAPLDLDTSAQFVVFHGQNAQGKTNALEAIWLLATLRPLRGHKLADLIGWSQDGVVVRGQVDVRGVRHEHEVRIDPRGRTARVDGDRVTDLGSYFRSIRAIAFQPSDEAVVSGGPGLRRRWLDRAAFTARPAHLDAVRQYGRVLQQKQAALRGSAESAVLDVLDTQLATLGAQVAHRRSVLLDELVPHVQSLHREISGGGTALELRYVTAAPGADPASRARALAQRLAANRAQECRRRTTVCGVQRDDVALVLGGHAARTFGSRGQVRSAVLSLKLAELLAARERGDHPVFLIDDVSSELDRDRTARLVSLLAELGTQVFATTTSPEHLGNLPAARTVVVHVEGGRLNTGVESADPAGSSDRKSPVDPSDPT